MQTGQLFICLQEKMKMCWVQLLHLASLLSFNLLSYVSAIINIDWRIDFWLYPIITIVG